MTEYTINEILIEYKTLVEGNKNSLIKRSRNYLDKRNYLIGILYYKYDKSEKFIGNYVNLNRCTVHTAKINAYTLLSHDDITFMANACDYIQRFPYEFPYTACKFKKGHTVVITLDSNMYKKIKKYQEFKGDKKINVTIRNLLSKTIKIWEE